MFYPGRDYPTFALPVQQERVICPCDADGFHDHSTGGQSSPPCPVELDDNFVVFMRNSSLDKYDPMTPLSFPPSPLWTPPTSHAAVLPGFPYPHVPSHDTLPDSYDAALSCGWIPMMEESKPDSVLYAVDTRERAGANFHGIPNDGALQWTLPTPSFSPEASLSIPPSHVVITHGFDQCGDARSGNGANGVSWTSSHEPFPTYRSCNANASPSTMSVDYTIGGMSHYPPQTILLEESDSLDSTSENPLPGHSITHSLKAETKPKLKPYTLVCKECGHCMSDFVQLSG